MVMHTVSVQCFIPEKFQAVRVSVLFPGGLPYRSYFDYPSMMIQAVEAILAA